MFEFIVFGIPHFDAITNTGMNQFIIENDISSLRNAGEKTDVGIIA